MLFDASILQDDDQSVSSTETKSEVIKSTFDITHELNSDEYKTVKKDNEKAIESRELNGFTCARKIYEESEVKLKSHDKKSRKSSQETVKKDLKSKKSPHAFKSVYEQILQSAKREAATPSEEIDLISTNTKNDSINEIVDSTESRSQGEKKRKNIGLFENIVEADSNKRVKLDEAFVQKLSEQNTEITIDNVDEVSTISNVGINEKNNKTGSIRDKEVPTTKDVDKKLSQKDHIKIQNLEIKEKLERKHNAARRSKQHSSKKGKKLMFPADKATQFETAAILKSFLMKYYPSTRIPDRTKFSKTCREMHHTLLSQKIFGTVYINSYVLFIRFKYYTIMIIFR